MTSVGRSPARRRSPVANGLGGALWAGSLSAGALSALAHSGAPWWAITLVAVGGTVGTASVGIVQAVFPQNSRDRLDWWRDRRGKSKQADHDS